MLAIISDLHLQQTHSDSLRYRAGHQVRQTGVRRNIKPAALDRLFRAIDEAADRHGSNEVHLVLAGDIFEFHRTPLWFFGDRNEVRPIDAAGPDAATNPLREKVRWILAEIAAEHAEVWSALRQRVNERQAGPHPISVHYLPGNHDRLANAWGSVRAEIRRLLGLPESEAPFPVRLDFTAAGIANYGVRVRHGHEYDPPNFTHSSDRKPALTVDWPGYLAPAFGDYITVDVATRLALAFRARYAAAMRSSSGERLRQLYLALLEFDDVRPASLLVDYLVQQMGAHRRSTFELLRPVLRDALETAVADPFFMEYARKHLPGILLQLVPELLKNLSAETIERAVRLLVETSGKPAKSPAEQARADLDPEGGFDLIIGGHTHVPELVSLPSRPAGPPALYLNSGTWRTTLPAGVESFGRLRAYTYVFCYSAAEQTAEHADGRRFESWTGHLSSDAIGPYDEPAKTLAPAATGVRQLRFTTLEVLDIQKEWRGAELRVNLGVDDQPHTQEWSRVRPGITYAIERPPLPLDPRLDGEVWFHGKELDLGTSILNPDDPLPWGIHRLARDPDTGQFQSGPGMLNLKGLRNTHLRLYFVVEPVA